MRLSKVSFDQKLCPFLNFAHLAQTFFGAPDCSTFMFFTCQKKFGYSISSFIVLLYFIDCICCNKGYTCYQ